MLIANILEAWAGIEPAYKSFADSCLTTWLPGQTHAVTVYHTFVLRTHTNIIKPTLALIFYHSHGNLTLG